MVPRHVAWRMAYRNDRYMRSLPLEQIFRRFRDFMGNLLVHSDDGRIAPLDVGKNEAWWIGYTHVLEELALRGQSWQDPGIDVSSRIVLPRSERVMKSIRASKKASVRQGMHYKFGKRLHMESMVHEGTLRIAPASSFANCGLNSARRDTELSVETSPSKDDLNRLCARDGLEPPTFGEDCDWTYVSQAKMDYFVYCVSTQFDHRLFDDFEAESCVVICDPRAFETKLQAAARERLGAWQAYGTEIEYVDPLFPPVERLNPFFCKHFRYFYQHEYRHFWIPAVVPDVPLQPFFLDLGPLRECCELLSLD
jgi:hypothetical protein